MRIARQSQIGHNQLAACLRHQLSRQLQGISRMRAVSCSHTRHNRAFSCAGAIFPVAAALFVGTPALADANLVNAERLEAAIERATARWKEFYGTTPSRIDADEISILTSMEWEEAIRSARRPSFIVWIAYESAAFNSPEDTARYLNEALIPFVKSHRDDYICHFAELYYGGALSADDIRKQAYGIGEAYFEYAYLYEHTSAARNLMNFFVDPSLYDVATYMTSRDWHWPNAEINLGCHQDDAENY